MRKSAGSMVVALVLAAPVDLRAAVASVADPVLALEDGEVLLETLECFLRSNGSPAAVARVMYVHRNTVRYRLQRVQELTGCGVASTAERVVWTLALLAIGRRRTLQPLPISG